MSLAAVKWARTLEIDDPHAEAVLLAISFRQRMEATAFGTQSNLHDKLV